MDNQQINLSEQLNKQQLNENKSNNLEQQNQVIDDDEDDTMFGILVKLPHFTDINNDTNEIIEIGLRYYYFDDYNEYIFFLEQNVIPLGLEKFMESSEITFFAGFQKYQNNQYDEAQELLNKSIQINKNNYKALNILAQIEQEINYDDVTTRQFLLLEAYRFYPDYYLTNINLGQLYSQIKQYTEAKYHYDKAIKELPKKDLSVYKQYAELLISQKEYKECLHLIQNNNIQREIKYYNDNNLKYDFYIILCGCLLKNNNSEKAIYFVELCFELQPSNYIGYYFKSQCLKDLGHYQEAISEMHFSINEMKKLQDQEIVINNSKNNISQNDFINEITQEKQYFEIGYNYYKLSQYEQSILYLMQSLERNNKYYPSQQIILKIYYEQKEYNLFLDYYEQCIIQTHELDDDTIFFDILKSNDIKWYYNINRIEQFMKNILLGYFNSIRFIIKIFLLIKSKRDIWLKLLLNYSNYKMNLTTKKRIQEEIYYIVTKKYIENSLSLLQIIGFQKHIQDQLQYLNSYSIWDLFID